MAFDNCKTCRYYLPKTVECVAASNTIIEREMMKSGLAGMCNTWRSIEPDDEDKSDPSTTIYEQHAQQGEETV